MVWLAAQIWILLAVSFAVGLGVGWWVWGALSVQLAAANRRLEASEAEAAELRRSLETGAEAPAPKPAEPEPVGVAPRLMDAPTEGLPDDLKRIKGIGPALEEILHGFGVYYFRQIAAWTPENVDWFDDKLVPKGRVGRDQWVSQARRFAGLEPASEADAAPQAASDPKEAPPAQTGVRNLPAIIPDQEEPAAPKAALTLANGRAAPAAREREVLPAE